MKKITSFALLAACLPYAALAQIRATDPNTPVPAVPYRSALPSLPQPPASTEVNLADWVKANAEVGRNLRGHIDILKWEAANAPPGTTEPQAGAELTPAQAVALALKNQPDLIGAPQPSALARAQLAAQALKLTHNVQRAWINALAARQALAHLHQTAAAAQIGAELGQRMARVGNLSRAQLLQEQLAQSAAARGVRRHRRSGAPAWPVG